MLVDLHVHTKLSSDSNVAAEQYLAAAAERTPKLGAICFTEHRLYPGMRSLIALTMNWRSALACASSRAIEADTKLGHLLIFGINQEIQRRFDLSDRLLRQSS